MQNAAYAGRQAPDTPGGLQHQNTLLLHTKLRDTLSAASGCTTDSTDAAKESASGHVQLGAVSLSCQLAPLQCQSID